MATREEQEIFRERVEIQKPLTHPSAMSDRTNRRIGSEDELREKSEDRFQFPKEDSEESTR